MSDKRIGSETNFTDMKNFKSYLFEFFKNINQFRSIKKFQSMLLITFSFLQIYYLLNEIIVVNAFQPYVILTQDTTQSSSVINSTSVSNLTAAVNSTNATSTTNSTNQTITNLVLLINSTQVCNYTKYGSSYYLDKSSSYFTSTQLSIFNSVNVAQKLSLLIPLLEYFPQDREDMFIQFYTIIFVFIYIFTIVVIASSIYILIKIIKGKEVYFKIFPDFISVSFLFIQWIFYIPIIFTLFYPSFGRKNCLLSSGFNNAGLNVINIIFAIFYITINYIISILNNDSISRYDNSLCRKDTDLETKCCYPSKR